MSISWTTRLRCFTPTRSLATLITPKKPIERCVVGHALMQSSLQALFDNKLYAIVITGFLDQRICAIVSKKLLNRKMKEYTNAPGIGRIGISFYETMNNPKMERDYIDHAIKNMQILRKIFSPYHAPIDHLRVALDEIWPAGSQLAVRGGKKMFAGLCRALKDGNGILPHEDKFERDDPVELLRPTFKAQAAVNVYLQVPEKGGELELYKQSLGTDEYDSLRKDSYGIARSLLPPPEVTIKPSNGDLVIFNSRRLHSVADTVGKTRLSVSCFIGFSGEDAPLKIWS